ncbi:Hypothetical predicted protein [Paramuricea clavata]|uniref:Uncharacterized protein n=1 Tax=Paramuricea clavata TaxID=317549 RepID=A0A7D9H9R8_PARCT|nr:Hypothetical predicted protein [Paramuricea clavata]
MFKRKSKRNESKIPGSNIVLFKKAVQRLPFDLNESQIQALIKVIEYINLETTEHVVVKRNMSPGLYVVVSGKVEAVNSNGGIALRLIKKGDFFGEVSTFFGSNCPVTIRGQEGAEFLFIKSQNILNVLTEKPKIGLFEWFIKRKYVDTAKVFQEHAVSKEVAYQSLQETPMFHNWSSDCLHFLVEQTLPEIILLFPAGSYIWRQGDHAREIFILVHGTAKILTSDKKELVTVSASNTSFCMGEEQFFNQLRRNFDIRAESPCLVLILNKDHLDHLFYSDIQCAEERELYDLLSHQWKSVMVRKDKTVYSKYAGQLDLEVISIRLWQAFLQRGLQIPFRTGFFHTLFLSVSAMEIDVGKEMLAANELYDVVVMLLKGCGEIYSENQSLGTIEAVGLYLPNEEVVGGTWIKATQTSLVIKIPASVVKSAQEEYPDVVVL